MWVGEGGGVGSLCALSALRMGVTICPTTCKQYYDEHWRFFGRLCALFVLSMALRVWVGGRGGGRWRELASS